MRRYLAILGAVLLTATACGSQAPSTQQTAPGATQAAQQPVRGGRIVEGTFSDIKTLLPTIATDASSSGVFGWVYIGLLRINPDTGDLEGGLAEKFEQSADGKKVTYTLRPNLVWSDGKPFTGEDYKYSAEAVARSKKSVDKSLFGDVTGWKDYIDGKTDGVAGIVVKDGGSVIEVTFDKVNCVAVRNISSAGRGILPKHHFVSGWDNKTTDATKNIDDHPLAMKPPASMGAFVFKEHQPGVQSTLVANDKYYRGRPNVDEYIVKVYADQTAIKAALLTGEVSFSDSIQPADVAELKQAGAEVLNFSTAKGVSNYAYIGWNQNSAKAPWLKDKRVRQALWYGVDVKTMVDKFVLGYGHQIYGPIPQASAFYEDPGFNKYSYDPAKAKQLLESAGAKLGGDGVYRWTDGTPMQMRIETNQGNKVREQILEVATEQYKKIGVKIDPLLETFPALLERTKCCGTDYEGFILGWLLGLDPDSAMMGIWHSQNVKPNGFSRIQYQSAEVDKYAEQGRNGPDCSIGARKKAYGQLQKAINDDAPYTFLYTADSLVFHNKAIQGVESKPFSAASIWNIEKWWIKR